MRSDRERMLPVRRGPIVLSVVFVHAVGFTAADAQAYCAKTTCIGSACTGDDGCPTGTPVRWRSSCVGIGLDMLGSKLLDKPGIDTVLNDVIRGWNEVDCGNGRRPSIRVVRIKDVDCGRAEYRKGAPNANVLFFKDTNWDGDLDALQLANAYVTFDKASGAIRDADVAVNTANHRFSLGPDLPGTFDLRSVLTHEMGHFLGLGHSLDPHASMFASVETGEAATASPTPDDAAGLCALYPPDEQRPCDLTPEGGFAASCPDDPPSRSGPCTAGPVRGEERSGLGAVAIACGVGLVMARRRASRSRPTAA